jgi:cell division protein ZapA (FtsZ GTPase activity inhibitor)
MILTATNKILGRRLHLFGPVSADEYLSTIATSFEKESIGKYEILSCCDDF